MGLLIFLAVPNATIDVFQLAAVFDLALRTEAKNFYIVLSSQIKRGKGKWNHSLVAGFVIVAFKNQATIVGKAAAVFSLAIGAETVPIEAFIEAFALDVAFQVYSF